MSHLTASCIRDPLLYVYEAADTLISADDSQRLLRWRMRLSRWWSGTAEPFAVVICYWSEMIRELDKTEKTWPDLFTVNTHTHGSDDKPQCDSHCEPQHSSDPHWTSSRAPEKWVQGCGFESRVELYKWSLSRQDCHNKKIGLLIWKATCRGAVVDP